MKIVNLRLQTPKYFRACFNILSGKCQQHIYVPVHFSINDTSVNSTDDNSLIKREYRTPPNRNITDSTLHEAWYAYEIYAIVCLSKSKSSCRGFPSYFKNL